MIHKILDRIGRLMCRVRGHIDPDMYLTPERGVVVVCPRCRLIMAGRDHIIATHPSRPPQPPARPETEGRA